MTINVQAALLIEFLRESPFGKAKFQGVRAIGRAPHNDRPASEAATRATYCVDLAGLEEKWLEYCKKRK